MSRRSGWIRRAALTVALLCGIVWALGTARAQVPPTEAPPATEAAGEAVGEAVDVAEEVAVTEAEIAEPEVPSPWSLGLVTSTIALTIGGVSSLLGIWVHRDDDRPVFNAIAMSSLVICAVCVGIAQGYLDAVGALRHEEDLARMLAMVDELALSSGDPALAEIVRSEGGAAAATSPAAEP